jgi:hypothetical protein
MRNGTDAWNSMSVSSNLSLVLYTYGSATSLSVSLIIRLGRAIMLFVIVLTRDKAASNTRLDLG